MDKKAVIEITNLSKSFKKRKIIDNINMVVEEGDVFGFLGPNGSGKTTTIRMMLNLIYPDQGTVKINGYDVSQNFNKAIEKVGAIVETPKFHPYLSGRMNLELMANLMQSIPKDKIDEVLHKVGLWDRADDKAKTYSLGMKQRLGIANALLNNPRLVILDEPTNGLDPHGMKEIRDMVSQLASEENITFFISTHLLHEVEQMCNKVAILHQGQIPVQGYVKDLLNINYELIEICTPSPDKAANLLSENSYIQQVEKSSRGLMVKLEKGNGAKLNHHLIKNDVDVEYSIPHNQSLEALFIDLTRGGDEDVQCNGQ